MPIVKPTKPTITLTVTPQGRYLAEYNRVVATTKTPQQLGALLRSETGSHVHVLRSNSPVSTGLLKRSWLYHTEAVTIKDTPVKQASVNNPQLVGAKSKTLAALAPSVIVMLLTNPAIAPAKVNILANTTAGSLLRGVPTTLAGRSVLTAKLVKLLPLLTKYALPLALLVAVLWAIHVGRNANRERIVRLYIRVSNRAPNSYFRLVGRAPGKQPPTAKLVNWAKRAKLPPELGYVIARKIAKDGTERYRTGQNIVGVDPNKVQHRGNSSFVRMLDRINEAV